MITEGSTAHPVRLGDIVWGLHLKEVHWPTGLIVLVDMEGQFTNPNTGNMNIHFDDVPKDKDTITINGTVITFGPSGEVPLGTDAASSAANFATYLNTSPHPVSDVTAQTPTGPDVGLSWDTPKLTLGKSSSALTLIGAQFYEDPSLEEGTVITKEKYDGLASYNPRTFNSGFRFADDLVYLVYVEIVDIPPRWKIENRYVPRLHRSVLVNMNFSEPVVEVDVFSPAQNNYIFIPPTAFPVRIMQPINNDFIITAYRDGTEFVVGPQGTITTTATPVWTFSKTITVEDTRGPPGNSIDAVDAYNAVGDSPPFPYARIKFDKDGEVD